MILSLDSSPALLTNQNPTLPDHNPPNPWEQAKLLKLSQLFECSFLLIVNPLLDSYTSSSPIQWLYISLTVNFQTQCEPSNVTHLPVSQCSDQKTCLHQTLCASCASNEHNELHPLNSPVQFSLQRTTSTLKHFPQPKTLFLCAQMSHTPCCSFSSAQVWPIFEPLQSSFVWVQPQYSRLVANGSDPLGQQQI